MIVPIEPILYSFPLMIVLVVKICSHVRFAMCGYRKKYVLVLAKWNVRLWQQNELLKAQIYSLIDGTSNCQDDCLKKSTYIVWIDL